VHLGYQDVTPGGISESPFRPTNRVRPDYSVGQECPSGAGGKRELKVYGVIGKPRGGWGGLSGMPVGGKWESLLPYWPGGWEKGKWLV